MATETVLNKLTINSVESREVYKKMQEKGLINEDEIYLVADDGSSSNDTVPTACKVKLTVAGWNSSTKTQSVTISGVSADEASQLLLPMPTAASKSAYDESGIQMTGQAANSVTFTCDTVPTAAIEVWVVIQSVKDVTPLSN